MDPGQQNPQFFLKREDGTIVPLTAISNFQATSIGRAISPSQSPYPVANLKADDSFESRRLQFVLEAATAGQVIDHSIGGGTATVLPKEGNFEVPKSSGFDCRPARSAYAYSKGLPLKAYGIQEQAPATLTQSPPIRQPLGPPATPQLSPISPTPAAATPQIDRKAKTSPAPASKPIAQLLPPWHRFSALSLKPAPGVKEYCSYWLRNGECDYAQQGCLYKHEMPLDKATLERVGLRDVPRWYREKHGLGSFLAVNRAKGGKTLAERRKKKDKEEMMDRSWRSHGQRGSGTIKFAGHARKRGGGATGPASILHSPSARGRPTTIVPYQTDDQNALATASGLTEKEKQLRKTLAELQAWEAAEKRRKAAATKKHVGNVDNDNNDTDDKDTDDNDTDDNDTDDNDTDDVVRVRRGRKPEPNVANSSWSPTSAAALASVTAAHADKTPSEATTAIIHRSSICSSDDDSDTIRATMHPLLHRHHRLSAARDKTARNTTTTTTVAAASPTIYSGTASADPSNHSTRKPARISRNLPYRRRIASLSGSSGSAAASAAEESNTKGKQSRRDASLDRLSLVSRSEFDALDRVGRGSRERGRDLLLDQYDHDD